MQSFIEKSKKTIVAMLLVMIILTMSPAIVLAAEETNTPLIQAQQKAGEVKAGAELKFTITDDTKLSYIFYAWNRRIDGNKSNVVTLADEPQSYEFKINAPTEPGLYEFSIAAQDYYGNINNWINIPYVVTNNPTGVVDNEVPKFIYNMPEEYPYNDSTIEQERPITIRLEDQSGIYYIAYKWTRELNENDYTTGTTVVYKTNTLQIKAPKEEGVWYLQMYARDGANNISKGYYTKLTIKDMVAPILTLNGPAEVDVPQNGTYEDPGATFNDNYDATKIVYANEALDTSKVGPQTLTYTGVDKAGNLSNTVSRTVTVVGTRKSYELTAPTKKEYNVNDSIDLTGASIKVTDERGNISYVTPTKDMFKDFSTATPNTKQIFFTYQDAKIIYEYNVKDYIIDIIVTPPPKQNYEYQEEFDITGGYVQKVMASGIETIKEKMTMNMLSGYNKEKLGEQFITVNYAGKQKDFKVTVKDTTKPVINLNGVNPQIIKKGENYIELGASVTDNYDKSLQTIIDATEVNTNKTGIYQVIYEAIDTSGNKADTLTRAIHIVDYAILQEKLQYIWALVESDYTVDTWQKLQEIVAESEEMITANTSIQTQIDAQISKIEQTINELQALQVNQEELDAYIANFVSTNYSNWEEFQILIDQARNTTDLQSKFDKELRKVKEFELIKKEIDTAKLDKIIEELNKLSSSDYTEESWNSIQEKILNAQEQTLQSEFNKVVDTIDLSTLIKLPKISNIIVTTTNLNSTYAKVGDKIAVTFDTNIELDLEKTITKINEKEIKLEKINENQYKFTHSLTLEDVEGLINYTIKPVGTLNNVGNDVQADTNIKFDKTSPSIKFAEGISDVNVNINDTYEIKDSDVVISDNHSENITIKTNKEILNLNELGNYTISYVAIDEAGNESEAITRTIHVVDYVKDIEIVAPTKTTYIYKEKLNLEGATVKKIMASGIEVASEAMTSDMLTGYNAEVIGVQTITVNYAGKTKTFDVQVNKAQYDMSRITFEDKTVTYNGKNQIISINGILPEGVTVSYTNNKKKSVGEYTAVAKFTVDLEHYEEIPDMTATLKIEKAKVEVTIVDKESVYGDEFVGLTSEVTAGEVVTGDDLGLTLTKAEGRNVGTYAITGTATNTNYEVTIVNGTYTITPREVTVTIHDKESIYGDEFVELTSEVTAGEVVTGDDLGLTLTKAEGRNVGTYAITGTATNTNYTVNFVNGTYTITPREVTVTIHDKESIYGDEFVELTSEVTAGEVVTGDDLGLTRTKAEGTDAGTYSITGTATNTNYTVNFVNGTYTITPRKITVIADNKASVYGEELKELTYTVPEGVLVDTDTEEALGIKLSKEEGLEVGNYAITGTSNSINYEVTVTPGNYEITKKTVTVVADDKTSVYGDTLELLTYTVPEGTLVGTDTEEALEIELNKEDGLTVGNYVITGTSNSTNYEVTVTPGNYEITKKAVTVTADDKTSVYGDALEELTYTVPEGTLVGEDTVNDLGIKLSKEDGLTVGSYAITGTANSANYEVTVTPGNYEITKKAVTVTVDNKTSVYGEALEKLTYTIPEGALVGTDTEEALGIELKKEEGLVVGNYAITGTSNSANYEVTVTPGNYEITKKAVTVTADNKTSVYGDNLEPLTYTVAEGTLVGEDTVNDLGIELNKEDGLTVGNYEITGTSNSANYEVTVTPGIYTITRRELSLSDLVYDLTSKQYTGEAQGLTITANETLVGFGNITVKYYQEVDGAEQEVGTPVAKGMYIVKVDITEGDNYSSVNNMLIGNYEITAKAPSIEDLQYDLTSKEYNGQPQGVEITAKPGIVGLGTITLKYNGNTEAPVNAGNYEITVDIATGVNYDSATSMQIGTYSITKKTVTVTADDKTSVYGEQLKELTYTVAEGTLVGEDTVDDLGIKLSKEEGLTVGSYAITGTANSANYEVTVTPGNYEITKKAVTVTVDNKTSVYGDALEELTYTIPEGLLVGTDTEEVLGIKLSKEDGLEVGNYAITGTFNSTNYEVTVTPGNYEITKKVVTVIADNKTSVYGYALEALTYTVADGTLVGTDTEEALGIELNKEDGLTVGNYAITGTSNSTNYEVTVTPGNYEITKKAVTVIADNKTSVYGEELKELTYTVPEGVLVDTDTEEALGIKLSKEDGLEVGNYAITGTSNSVNYEVTVTPGNYEITKKAVTVIADNKTSVYGEELKELTYTVPEGVLVDTDTEEALGIKLSKEEGLEVGNYAITGISNSTNYEVTVTPGNYEITKKAVTVIADNKTSIYGEELKELTYTIPEGTLVDTDTEEALGIELNKEDGLTVGNYAITGTSNSTNYEVTVTPGNYEITKKVVTVTADDKTSVYGEELKELTYTVPEGTLVGEDTVDDLGIKLSKEDGLTVGNYAITGTSNSVNYEVIVTPGNYEMTKKVVTVTADNKTSVYGDALEELTYTVEKGTLVGTDTEEALGIELQKEDGLTVGSYAITGISNSVNYEVTVTPGNYEITKKTVTVTADDKTSVYGDALETLTYTVAEGTLVGSDTEEALGIELKKEDGLTVGSYAITGTSNSANYEVTVTPGIYTITRREPSLSDLVYDLTSKEYTGEAQGLTITANETLVGFGNITVKYYQEVDGAEQEVGTPVAKGMYIVKVDITEGDNYTSVNDMLIGNYEITAKSPSIEDLQYDRTSKEYNGQPQGVEITVKPGIVGLGTITVKYNGNTEVPVNAGNYEITVDIATGANYDSATSMQIGTYSITKKAVTVIADNKTSVYGDVLEALTYTVADGTLVGTDTEEALGIKLSKEDGLTVGNYAITGTSNSTNYEVRVTPGNYEITKKAVTVIADNKKSIYGEELKELTYTVPEGVLVDTDTEEALGINLSKEDGLEVGNYAITGTSNSANYEVTVTAGNYEITKKAVTVTADNKTSVYGEALEELTYTVLEGTLVGEDTVNDLEIELSKEDGLTVGNYAITGTSNSANYEVTITPGNYEITKKVVTVTADNKTSVYGDALEELTYTVPEGVLVDTDTEEALGIELNKEDGLTVGNYEITGTSNSANYEVTVTPGNYEITKKVVTVTADNKTSVYGNALEELTYTLVDGTLVGEDTVNDLGIQLKKEDGVIVGNYEITGTSNSANYEVTVTPGNYEITKKAVTVTADNKTSVYGEELEELTYTIPEDTLVDTDTEEVLGIELNKEDGLTVGNYAITGTSNSANYGVTVTPGIYTITRREPSLSDLVYDLTSKQYTGEAQGLTITANETLVGFGNITVKYYQEVDGAEQEVGTPVAKGMYIVKVDITEGDNYSSVNNMLIGNYEITAKAPSIEDLQYDLTSKEYNGQPQGLEITAKPGIVGLGTITVKYNGNTEVPVNAGNYEITVDIATGVNYDSAISMQIGTYSITKKAVTVIADNKTSVYGEALEALTYTVADGTLVGEDTVNDLGIELSKEDGVTVGNYAITGTSNSTNYEVTVTPGNYEIIKKAVTVTADDKTSIYGEALEALTYTVADGTLVGEDTVNDLGIELSKEDGLTVGNYTITGTSNSANYEVTVTPGNYEITKKAVTATADDKTSVYGDALEELTYTIPEGTLVEEDTVDDLGIELSKEDGLEVGNYAITGTSNSANYEVTITPGNYEITKKVVTVTADNKTSVYGDALEELTYTIPEGTLVEEDTVDDLGIELSKEDGLEVGNYAITGTSNSANYEVTITPGNYEITKKVVTVTADNKTSVYGDALEELTYTMPEGTLVGTDTEEALGIELKKEDGLTVGSYAITGTSNSANYEVTVTPGIYTITRREPSLSDLVYDLTSKEYTGEAQGLTITANETLVGFGNITVKYYQEVDGAEQEVGTPVAKGMYIVKVDITEGDNYTSVNDMLIGNYEITAKSPSIEDLQYDLTSKEYNGQPQGLEITAKPGIVGLGTITVKYNGSAEVPVNAGNYEVTVDIATGANYDSATSIQIGTYEIKRKDVAMEDFNYTLNDKEYNTQAQGIEVTVKDGIMGMGTITISYNKVNGDEVTKVEGTPINAGTYQVVINIAEGTNYNAVDNMILGNYAINKINPEYLLIDELQAIYGQTLAEITLPTAENGVFTWNDTETTTVGNANAQGNKFMVTYTPNDTENYNTLNNIEVNIIVAKANPNYPEVNKLQAIYGQTLADVVLPTIENGVFTWNDVETITVGNANEEGNKFMVTYTPNDTANYNTLTNIEANIIVAKAEGTKNPDFSVPQLEAVVYNQDKTLADIALPTNWTWEDSAIVPEIGTMNYKANYTSENSNYEDVNSVDVSLTVLQPADHTILNEYLEEIGYASLVGTDYTNWNEFEKLVEEAKKTVAQKDLDVLLANIKAYKLQVKPVEQTKLDEYENTLVGIVGTDYSNWDELQQKIAEARLIKDLQSKFDAKMEEITSLKMITKPVNKTAVKELEMQLAMKNKNAYSASSWQAVEEKINQAKVQILQSKFDEIIASINLETDLLPRVLESINISALPKVNYIYGDDLDLTNGKIELVYDNGVTEEIDMTLASVTGYNHTKLGEQELTVNYLEKTAIYRINVVNAIKEIIVTSSKIDYIYGEELDLTKVVVQEVLKDNTTNVLNENQYSITGYDAKKLGEQTVTVMYNSYKANFIVTVNDSTKGIEIKQMPNKTTYLKGQELITEGLVLEKVMLSGKTEKIDLNNITITGYNTTTLGTQNITVSYQEAEEVYTVTFDIVVLAGEKTEIVLNGASEVNVEVNTTYKDLGATAYSTNLESEIPVTVEGLDKIDLSVLVSYTITYKAEDADPVTRTVNVVDTTKPVIIPSNDNVYELALNSEKPVYKATVTDNYDANLQGIEIQGTDDINTAKVGTYEVKFIAKDSSNNESILTKTVIVKDSEAPVIKITGDVIQVVEVNTEYAVKDVVIEDNSNEKIALNISKNNLNMKRLGTYTVIYTAKDSSGNEATPVERTVKVVDTIAPVIHTDKMEYSFIIGRKDALDLEKMVTVTDNYDTEIKVTYDGNVDLNKIGTYKVMYSAVDASGNEAKEVEITVKVTDYAPVISYHNDDNIKVEITDGQIFHKHMAVMYDKGTASIKQAGENEFKPYNGEILGEGTFTIKVEATDGTSSQKTFTIDTLPPVVIGIKRGSYTTAKTITFEDIDDIGTATLTRITDGKVIDIKAELDGKTGICTYTVDESGEYILRVEDKNGNAIRPIEFEIVLTK